MSRRKTVILDATNLAPGRLATKIATLLMGKDQPSYSPHLDLGSKVVVENAGQVVFSGKKIDQKLYRHHSNHPGGLKEIPAKKVFNDDPSEVIRLAVVKMLPKNKLRDGRLRRLSFKK
ncbi:MAG: 50S ribosomal protein L13 [Candidatus Magasanikbacteria bacterium RIFOXYD2_FULL_41_14]|uniref:Large ribosomal subunit protein uL13 n=1 Tax=Candidatus Magasanikbacteria bacterium RIFOXYD2_FULL_41_14 TaxID=1798709 RepID=A0A1F6PFR9_9BACT|nr:MAG: 50S ribosomal protein L13 [Candidatus Magasanikbacteria bacterium RIFOXYD2_FULL_41_14]